MTALPPQLPIRRIEYAFLQQFGQRKQNTVKVFRGSQVIVWPAWDSLWWLTIPADHTDGLTAFSGLGVRPMV